MGPEGGSGGGMIVAQGTPEQVVGVAGSHTAQFLAQVLDVPAPSQRTVRSRATKPATKPTAKQPPKPAAGRATKAVAKPVAKAVRARRAS